MVVETPYKDDEKETGMGADEELDNVAAMAEALAQVGINFGKAFGSSHNPVQLAEEVPRANRQESFGKLFRKKGRRW